MTSFGVKPSAPLRGVVSLPGDKSISHRAIIFSALSHQTVRIENLLEAEDVLRTVTIFQKLGVKIRRQGKIWIVKGRGPDNLHPYPGVLYCGNSGTTMRLMMGVLAALPFKSELTGDASLDRRPMERVAKPLRQMGAKIEEISRGGKRIIRVEGPVKTGIHYRLPIASAQLKSAILLAGMVSGLPVKVTGSTQSRDHTERMLRLFYRGSRRPPGRQSRIGSPPQRPFGAGCLSRPVSRLIIPGDPSSAAFFVVAGLINPDRRTRITLKKVCLNPTRIGFLKVLKRMGGRVEIRNRRFCCGEPIGDLVVRPSRLKGSKVRGTIVPQLIDEVPVLAVAAARAQGRSDFSDMEELRVKESDRIAVLVRELPSFGVPIRERKSGFSIQGGPIGAARVPSHGDHRIAMSLVVLGTVAQGVTLVKDVDCIQTSFPQFVSTLKSLGVKMR